MKAEYDFSKGRPGQAVPTKGRTRTTIYVGDQILAAFKAESVKQGIGDQTLSNDARHLLGGHRFFRSTDVPRERLASFAKSSLTRVNRSFAVCHKPINQVDRIRQIYKPVEIGDRLLVPIVVT